LSAAAELFSEKGYEGTSIEAVTERANFSKGTFYYHFQSKDELVLELRRFLLSGTLDQALEILNQSQQPLTAPEKLFLDPAQFTERQPELSSIFLMERIQQFLFREEHAVLTPPEEQPEGKPKRRFRRAIYEMVCEAQKRGQVRPDLSPEEITGMIIAFYLHA